MLKKSGMPINKKRVSKGAGIKDGLAKGSPLTKPSQAYTGPAANSADMAMNKLLNNKGTSRKRT
jgi:hypothetical protein